ncbi:MAG: DUF805 domain-containing protein [Telluria sp.]
MDNPYDAPVADLSRPVDGAASYPPAFFSLSGRLGRVRYVAYLMGAAILATLAIAGFGILVKLTGLMPSWMLNFVPLLATLVALAASMVYAVRRLNDLNRTGWLSLLLLVPIVNLVFGLWLLFGPGDKGTNRYGLPPGPNGAGVIAACCVAVLAGVFFVLAVFGIYKIAQLGLSGNSRYSEHNPR